MIIFALVLYAASVIVHVLEREAQPATFGTIHGTLWWAIVTLTTTGYGDAVPVTGLGRIVAAFVMICGIGVLGMLVGVLATGYAAEARRSHFIRTWELVSKVPFFSNLAHGAIVDVTNMLRRLELPPRAIVVRKGAPGDCMYFIASGEVEVELPDRKIPLAAGQLLRRARPAQQLGQDRDGRDDDRHRAAGARPARFPHPDGAASRSRRGDRRGSQAPCAGKSRAGHER